ncbi:MAG: hypothetical protein HQL07_08820 [Nitrospirae bacterium]|nr:hypothetical protein [Magnetococcales bacterium]
MMIKKIGMLMVSSFFVSSLAIAAAPPEDQEIDKRTCQKWAQEDGIAADKMDGYITKCMAELAGTVDQYGGQDAIPDGAPPMGGAAPAAPAPAAPAATAPAAPAAPAPAAPAAPAPAKTAPAKK